MACHKPDRPPYVCNTCRERKLCIKDKYIYTAVYADAAVSRRRSESRQGIRLTEEQKKSVDKLVTRLVRKGQPLTHIYAEHEEELPVSLRSLYNYIDAGELTIKNIDLRRKVGYRRRKRKNGDSKESANQTHREGRTYEDYESYIQFTGASVWEMDTVKGSRKKGKRLLTMIFQDNSIMLLFLMPDGKAESVKRIFDYLERGLGIERFQRLFQVFLTDNGSEFKRPDDLELTEDYEYRTRIFYCDPMASWQKPHIEKNHEFIRYVIPRGKSFDPYIQEDMTLLMNHINSTKRPGLEGKAPYELINEDDEDMKALFDLLKMDLIPPDEVHLMSDLFARSR
jgi:IS30 family transposase